MLSRLSFCTRWLLSIFNEKPIENLPLPLSYPLEWFLEGALMAHRNDTKVFTDAGILKFPEKLTDKQIEACRKVWAEVSGHRKAVLEEAAKYQKISEKE